MNEMAVLPERQGHGIGTQLLNAVKEYSKEKGLAGIVLYTSEYAPAAQFYKKNGFQVSILSIVFRKFISELNRLNCNTPG